MADFVSRSKVEFELCGGNLPEKYKAFVKRVLNDKALVPAADVTPLRYGHWVKRYRSGTPAADGWVSSCCDMWAGRKSHYCPHCGAKMEVATQ